MKSRLQKFNLAMANPGHKGGGDDEDGAQATFLEELEIAKALSLETLELDQIRRRRYMSPEEHFSQSVARGEISRDLYKHDVQAFNKAISSQGSSVTNPFEETSRTCNLGVSTNVCAKRGGSQERLFKENAKPATQQDTRSRPRPAPFRQAHSDAGKVLPPPPSKTNTATASSASEYSDLMTFSGSEHQNVRHASSDLAELMNIAFDQNATSERKEPPTDVFNLPLFTDFTPAPVASTSSTSNCFADNFIPPVAHPGGNVVLASTSIIPSSTALIPTALLKSSASYNAQSGISTPFHNAISAFPTSQLPLKFQATGALPMSCSLSAIQPSALNAFSLGPLATGSSTVSQFAPTVPSACSSTQFTCNNTPNFVFGAQRGSSLSTVDVLKVIEKKPNENLIDLSYFDTIVMWGSSSGSKTKDDLLTAFDPLLENVCHAESIASTEKCEESFPKVKQLDAPTVSLRKPSEHRVTFSDSDREDIPDVQLRRITQKPNDAVKSRAVSYKRRCSRIYESIRILSNKKSSNQELEEFRDSLIRLRREFLCDDYHTNIGFVISPTLESLRDETVNVMLVVYSSYTEKPISFACDVTTSVEHAISQAVCTIFDDIRNINLDSYVLKVHGLAEYFSADSCLADYEYVHQCHKFDEDVHLTLLDTSHLFRPLVRTAQDDAVIADIQVSLLLPPNGQAVSQKTLTIIAETLEREIVKLREQAAKGYSFVLQPKGVIQAVKALCSTLAFVETKEVTEAVEDIQQVAILFARQPLDSDEKSSCDAECDILTDVGARTISKLSKLLPNTPSVRMELLQLSLERINEAVRSLLDMFSQGFQLNLKIPQPDVPTQSVKDITTYLDTMLIHVASVHRIPPQWATGFEYFIVSCELYHGTRLLCDAAETKSAVISTSFYEQIVFDDWVELKEMLLCLLPREARLCCVLYGIKTVQSESKPVPESGGVQLIKVPLGWASVQLFDHNGILSQGSLLCGMWSNDMDRRLGPAACNVEDAHCPIMQINLPDFGSVVLFPPIIENCPSQRKDFETLPDREQQRLLNFIEKLSSPLCNVVEEREALWDRRHYLYDIPQALPKVLLAAYSWDWACLADIYCMLHQWRPMDPLDALELLLPCFPDLEVRKIAITWIKDMGSDELCDYLPQLVQALKYETYLDSPTAWFLIERSLTSIRFLHHLYWLLKQNLEDIRSGQRILLLLNSLLAIAGKSIRKQLDNQEKLMEILSVIAEKIKTTKDSLRLNMLHHELENTHYLLEDMPTSLPLSPSMEVCGLDIKMCNYYTSRTLPVKLNFRSVENQSKPIEALFKDGDDLRQDMITLQMIRIMDKLWLKEGLDLKVVTFACVPTGNRKGIVEMIKDAETLRKIQTEHGLTGSFKDHPIAEWLQRHNASESEYLQAVENFTLSCAGCSVATYVLGICDRHNDNIMLKTSGHIFHIDFGKFLGDSQLFGSIKRDRVPFVLTSDMAYVINLGDKPSSRFHNFVDLCCQAFNVLRRHGNLFLHLFALMVSSGIPGLTTEAVGYVQRALLLEMSDVEAAVHFSRMIEDSLKSWFTQFNFFMHNLAQLRFNGEQSCDTLLSFVPKTYTMETEGKIRSWDVIAYQKRYEPEKVYMYVLCVKRHGQPGATYLFRSYREFCEFHQKLCSMFPLAKYKSLPRSLLLGRSNIRQVAEKRKDEIRNFLKSLWKTADEIKHCDLVYTFFHQLLRDQNDDVNFTKVKELPEKVEHHEDNLVAGQIKLSLHYKKDTFFVLICHARNLSEVKGQTPDSYVKIYLLPDPTKATKRKTKVVRKNSHPTFMEMLIYRMPLQAVSQRILYVSVWDYDRMAENAFLGCVSVTLSFLDLTKETTGWYSLEKDGSLLK